MENRNPTPSSLAAKHRMEATKAKNTKPEIELRKALCALGINRYRIDHKVISGLRRKADIAFPSKRVAIFVDGCFWHGCAKHGTIPKSNVQFWRKKIEANIARDKDTNKRLKAAGWKVVRVWEHEDTRKAALRIERSLKD